MFRRHRSWGPDPGSHGLTGGFHNGQPPWDPRGRVAVVINDHLWPATVTGQPAPGVVTVTADCGVTQALPLPQVYSLGQAAGYLAGRVIGLEVQATTLATMGQRGRAAALRTQALKTQSDLVNLRRG